MAFYNSENMKLQVRQFKIKEQSESVASLVKHIKNQCKEIYDGSKPATLVSLQNRTESSGINFYQSWQSAEEIIKGRIDGIETFLLQTRENSVLLLCYNPAELNQHLTNRNIKILLERAGFKKDSTTDGLLQELKLRIERNKAFPYQIGLFTGYSYNIIDYYDEPVDCLTAHLMLECSEVLAEVKPANLISIVNRKRPCGRNLYQIWKSENTEVRARLNSIEFLELNSSENSILLLCYSKAGLERHLSHLGIRTLLDKTGYNREASLEELLESLKVRIKNSEQFPHEIGLFIGYPPKDVAAFMGLINLPLTCQGPWKIYGNPLESLNLVEQYRCCRQKMCAILTGGNKKTLELNQPGHPFFSRDIDIRHHNHGGYRQ